MSIPPCARRSRVCSVNCSRFVPRCGPCATTTVEDRLTETGLDTVTDGMTTQSFLLPIEFDLAATFLMAMTGVWAAGRRGYDVVGAFTLAFLSGVGGGLLRDSIFLSQPPAVMQNGLFLVAVVAALVVGVLFHRLSLRFERLMAYVDALALAVYAVVGADKALVAGISAVGAVVIGMTNAVGGGLMRDIVVREEPLLFKPGQFYVLAALGGCALFVALRHYDFSSGESRGRFDLRHAAAAPARNPLQLDYIGIQRVVARVAHARDQDPSPARLPPKK